MLQQLPFYIHYCYVAAEADNEFLQGFYLGRCHGGLSD